MLANNYKTATDLGISEVEVQALIKVLGMLERGDIDEAHFTMANLRKQTACGTVGCICGWAHIVSSGAAFPEVFTIDTFSLGRRLPAPAIDLFAIQDGRVPVTISPFDIWHKARASHAAIALRSYLTTGDARWDLALAS